MYFFEIWQKREKKSIINTKKETITTISFKDQFPAALDMTIASETLFESSGTVFIFFWRTLFCIRLKGSRKYSLIFISDGILPDLQVFKE